MVQPHPSQYHKYQNTDPTQIELPNEQIQRFLANRTQTQQYYCSYLIYYANPMYFSIVRTE